MKDISSEWYFTITFACYADTLKTPLWLQKTVKLTIMEFSLTAGAIGAALAPQLVAIGAIAAMAKDWTIIVEIKIKEEVSN